MDADAFARSWEAGWNAHDLDRVMAHYSADIVFRSRKAIPLVGDGYLRGKDALQAYWAKALANQPDLHFTVVDVFEGFDMVVLTYRNHRGVLAAETLRFDADGTVVEASACHRR
ncbi:MAG: nuclear transport factor 2 family protein [Pseudomonadota bacterium]